MSHPHEQVVLNYGDALLDWLSTKDRSKKASAKARMDRMRMQSRDWAPTHFMPIGGSPKDFIR